MVHVVLVDRIPHGHRQFHGLVVHAIDEHLHGSNDVLCHEVNNPGLNVPVAAHLVSAVHAAPRLHSLDAETSLGWQGLHALGLLAAGPRWSIGAIADD